MTKAQQLGITEFPYYEYDSNGNLTYIESSDGDWAKYEYDDNGNEIYCEDSYGEIVDNRPNKSKLRIIRTSDKQIFDVKKYIHVEGTEHHVWCDEWYGRHVIGQDCEWVN